MTLTLNSDCLRRAAALFRRAKIRSCNLPILGHVRVTAAPGEAEATLEVTDLDLTISMRIPFAGPSTPGSFTIPIGDLQSIARTADRQSGFAGAFGSSVRFDLDDLPPAPPVDLDPPDADPSDESDETPNPCARVSRKIPRVHVSLTTKAMRTTLEIISLDPTDFPDAPVITGPPVIMSSAALAAIRRVRPCTSKDETRYVLNGVFISRAEGGLAVATDGRRLALVNAPFATPDAILPNLLADLLFDPACQSAALWRNDEDAEIASLTFGKTTITSKLISGNFPNFRQVIPDPASRLGSATFPDATIAPLTAWLRNYPGETVILAFDPPANTITFEIRRTDQGQYSTTALAAFNGTVPPVSAYNATFLADALAMNLHTMDLIDERSPAVLTDGLTRYVLMPMRRKEGTTTFAPEPEAYPPEDPPEEEDEAPADHTEPADDPAVIDAEPAEPQTPGVFGLSPEPQPKPPAPPEDAVDAEDRENNIVAIGQDQDVWKAALSKTELKTFKRLRNIGLATLSQQDRDRFQSLQTQIFKHAERLHDEEAAALTEDERAG